MGKSWKVRRTKRGRGGKEKQRQKGVGRMKSSCWSRCVEVDHGPGEGGLGRCSERWDLRRRESRASDFPEPKAPTSLGQSCAEAVSQKDDGHPSFCMGLWGRASGSVIERDGLGGPEHPQSLRLRGHDFEHCRESRGGQQRARPHLQQEGGRFLCVRSHGQQRARHDLF